MPPPLLCAHDDRRNPGWLVARMPMADRAGASTRGASILRRACRAALDSAPRVPLSLFARSRHAREVPAGETLTHSGTPDRAALAPYTAMTIFPPACPSPWW